MLVGIANSCLMLELLCFNTINVIAVHELDADYLLQLLLYAIVACLGSVGDTNEKINPKVNTSKLYVAGADMLRCLCVWMRYQPLQAKLVYNFNNLTMFTSIFSHNVPDIIYFE